MDPFRPPIGFFLSLPSDPTKVLSVDNDGKLSFTTPETKDVDNRWNFHQVYEKNVNISDIVQFGIGYYIVSTKYRMALDYNPDISGEEIVAIPFRPSAKHTLWFVSDVGEIFTLTEDGEKYLWSLLDHIYVTGDEYLAEPWKVTPADHSEAQWACQKENTYSFTYYISIAFLIALFFYLLFGSK